MAGVKCSACGKMKFVNPKALKARIKKYGSIEEIERNWKCRLCEPEKVKKQKEAIKAVAEKSEEYEEPAIQTEETNAEYFEKQ